LAGEEVLHETFFLLLQGCVLLLEELDFVVAGLEDGSDCTLFFY
jgi:hypothetical protein